MNKLLSAKVFLASHFFLLLLALAFLGGLYYILNQDFPKPSLHNINPVTKEPSSFNLEINNPDDELLMYEKSIIVSGQTSPFATVVISWENGDLATEASQKGEFSKVLVLNPGLNNITISVVEDKGNIKQETRTVYYSEEKI